MRGGSVQLERRMLLRASCTFAFAADHVNGSGLLLGCDPSLGSVQAAFFVRTLWEESVSMNTTKLNKWGNSTGVVLPKKLLEHVGLHTGDTVHIAADSASGTIKLTRVSELSGPSAPAIPATPHRHPSRDAQGRTF